MTVQWTVRAANDRGPQAESRVLFEAPKKTDTHLSVCLFYVSDMILICVSVIQRT